MDMLKILLNHKNIGSVCFLCYKSSEKTLNLHENIELHDEYFDLNLTLWDIMKQLFPTQDVLLPQACDDCSSLIIKMFSLLQRNYLKNEMLKNLIDSINEEVDYRTESEIKLKKLRIKVELPTCESIMNNSRKPVSIVKCKKCSMKFKSSILLQKHFQVTHKNTNNAAICDICGKVFSKTATLKAHLKSHTEKQCPLCLKKLKSHSHFNLHLKNHNALTRRIRRKKYKSCMSCDYKSLNKSTLEAHINKVHLNIRPFVCEICQKGFYKKSNLTQHFVTHENKKNTTCEICGDSFVNEKTLIEHRMLHSGQKPFKCEICDTGFITSGRRLEHMKRKHMEKSERCIVCDKKFSLKKGLKAHLKNVHGAESYILKLENELTDYQIIKVIPK